MHIGFPKLFDGLLILVEAKCNVLVDIWEIWNFKAFIQGDGKLVVTNCFGQLAFILFDLAHVVLSLCHFLLVWLLISVWLSVEIFENLEIESIVFTIRNNLNILSSLLLSLLEISK